MKCPDCGKYINDNNFELDPSEVPGFLDIGYECPDCKIEIYTFVVKKLSDEKPTPNPLRTMSRLNKYMRNLLSEISTHLNDLTVGEVLAFRMDIEWLHNSMLWATKAIDEYYKNRKDDWDI